MAIDLRKEWEQLVKPHLWLKKSQATRKCPWLAIICNTSLFLVNLSTKPLFSPFSLSWWIVFQKEGENDVLMMKGSYNSVKPYFSGVVNDTPKTTRGLCWRGGAFIKRNNSNRCSVKRDAGIPLLWGRYRQCRPWFIHPEETVQSNP